MKELKQLTEILNWFISLFQRFLAAFGIELGVIDQVTGVIDNIGKQDVIS